MEETQMHSVIPSKVETPVSSKMEEPSYPVLEGMNNKTKQEEESKQTSIGDIKVDDVPKEPQFQNLMKLQKEVVQKNENLESLIAITSGKLYKIYKINKSAPEIELVSTDKSPAQEHGKGVQMKNIHFDVERSRLITVTRDFVCAVDFENGENIWKTEVGIKFHRFSSVVVASEIAFSSIIVICNGHLVCFDLQTGKPSWKTKLGGEMSKTIGYSLKVIKDRIYVGGHGIIWSIDPSSGKEMWNLPFKQHLGYNTFVEWNESLIVSNDKSLFLVSPDGAIKATKDRTRGVQYPAALITARDYLIQAYGGIVRGYFSSVENQVWKNNLRGMGYAHGMSLALYDEMFVIVGMRGKVSCLTVEKGKTVWTALLIGSVMGMVTVQVFQNRILALCDGLIYCLDPAEKGKELWSIRIGEKVIEPGEIASTAGSSGCNQTLLGQHIDFQQRNRLFM